MGLSLRNARANGQNRLRAVQRLNLALLVHAEDHSLVGRIQIQPHYVADLGHELRVRAELEGFHPVRLQPIGLPDSVDRRPAHTLRSGHGAHTPMGGVGRLAVERGFHYRSFFLVCDTLLPTRPWGILQQSFHSRSGESIPPF